MTRDKLKELYDKEREYQRQIFGNYDEIPTLNFGSFLLFVETYLEKAKRAYTSDWGRTREHGIVTCREALDSGVGPFKAYEELIKVFALAGAALETYVESEPEFWRSDGVKPKWVQLPPEE